METPHTSRRFSPQLLQGPRGFSRVLAFLLSSFMLHPSALSQTTRSTLTADVGFAGVFKPDSFAPVYITISDTSIRPGTVEIRTARGRVGNVISARIQSNPKPTTFTLYTSLDPLDRVSVRWSDDSGKRVASIDLSERARQNPAALGGPAFGVAGSIFNANRVAAQIVRDTGEYVAAGAIPERLLPERSVGFQSIDVLVLPELDTDAIDDAVESAIVDWMRAGGMVITWPGAQVPAKGSPIAEVLPAALGDVAASTIEGRDVSVRAMHAADESIHDCSNGTELVFVRKIGLGQIAMFGFDPTKGLVSAESRIAAMRRATGSQISMSPDDRRAGRFDPLVYQARGEEQLKTAAVSHDMWLWIALVFGLAMGPSEALLLMLCRRSIVTPLSMASVAIAIGSGLGMMLRHDRGSDATIEIVVEDDAGIISRYAISTKANGEAAASWLAGSSPNPEVDSSGELSLSQREDRFILADPLTVLGTRLPRIRSIDNRPAKPLFLLSAPNTNSMLLPLMLAA